MVLAGLRAGLDWAGKISGSRPPNPPSSCAQVDFPPSADLAENPRQRLTGAAQTIIYPLAAMRGAQLCGPEPQEVGRDRGGSMAEPPDELCSGTRHKKRKRDTGDRPANKDEN